MRPMQGFDPDRPSRVHDTLNDITFVWRPAWGDNWRCHAWVASDGLAFWDGLILDGWEPMPSHAPPLALEGRAAFR